MQPALLRVGQIKLTHGPGRADIAESALFLQCVSVMQGTAVGKKTVLHSRHEHQRKLEPFGRMKSHELHAVLPAVALGLAGLQHRVGEESCEGR